MAEPWCSSTHELPDEGDIAGHQRVVGSIDHLARSVAGGLAIVAFGLLADSTLSTSIGCILLGYDEIRLSRWLRRTDPVRERGRACSWFYLAWGLWRISLGAAAMFFCTIVFDAAVMKGQPKESGPAPLPSGIMGCLFIMLIGVLLSSAVSSGAMISAVRHRVRVWVGPEARRARERKAWPPRSDWRRGPIRNRARVILLAALITTTMAGVFGVWVPFSYILPQASKSPIVLVVFALALMVGVPILVLVLLEKLGRRMIAPTPEACWTGDAWDDRRGG